MEALESLKRLNLEASNDVVLDPEHQATLATVEHLLQVRSAVERLKEATDDAKRVLSLEREQPQAGRPESPPAGSAGSMDYQRSLLERV